MVKHNNVLPNVHMRKYWQRFVRTWFNQVGRKKSRRIQRQKKAAENGIRPIGLLRPQVRPPTIRYNMKLRCGRGFTFDELRAAGVSEKFARTIGISVDHRRKNRCAEGLNANVARLKKYISKLVIASRKSKAKKGIGGLPDDTQKSTITNLKQVSLKVAMPLDKANKRIKARQITKEEKEFKAYATLRKARRDAHNVGKRKEKDEGKI